MAGCVALMESPNAGEAEAAKSMLAKLEAKYGRYVAESTATRADPFSARRSSDFGQWAHKARGFDPAGVSDATGLQVWEDADMADLAAECARWLWSSGWYCQAEDHHRWNVCPEEEVGNWIKYHITNADLIRFAFEKGFGIAQLGDSGDRLTQYRQAISAPEFDISVKPENTNQRAPRKNFDPTKAPNKKGFVA